MRHFACLVLFLFASCSYPAQPVCTAHDPAVQKRIDGVVNGLLPQTGSGAYGRPAKLGRRMGHYHTPGVSIAVVNNGVIEWACGFGAREKGTPEPVTPETLFQAGSISKPVFALAVMRLVEEGRLDLDEDVNRRLTSWKVPASGSWQPRITLRQILSHSAGLTVHGFPGYGADEPIPRVVDVLNGRPPANTDPVRVDILPGVQFRYSGGGTTVAQQLVVDALGKPFPRILRELVLDPLGMAHSTYEQPLPPDRAAMAATAHPEKARPLPGRWHVYPEMAAAGLWTTPSDLARAGIELQRTLRGDPPRLLRRETIAAMLTSQIGEEMGIGFFLEGRGDDVRFGHAGWDEGFVAQAAFYRDRGLGAVVMLNSNEGNPLLGEILRAVAREYGWPGYFPPENAPDEAAEASQDGRIWSPVSEREGLDALTGEYATGTALLFTVTRQGEKLFLAVAGQPPIELRPESRAIFHLSGLDGQVLFEEDGESHVHRLVLEQDGIQTVARKRGTPPAGRELESRKPGSKEAS